MSENSPFEEWEVRLLRAGIAREGFCANCAERPGTQRWGDALAVTHGLAPYWCERCVVVAQVSHAEERAAALPELRKRLAALSGPDRGSDDG